MLLTDQHIKYLTYVARFRPTIHAVSEHLHLRLASVSMMRHRFRDEGLIEDWQDYNDRLEITEDGRELLKEFASSLPAE